MFLLNCVRSEKLSFCNKRLIGLTVSTCRQDETLKLYCSMKVTVLNFKCLKSSIKIYLPNLEQNKSRLSLHLIRFLLTMKKIHHGLKTEYFEQILIC